MATVKIALANVPFPESHEASIDIVMRAIDEAAKEFVSVICFPECIIPGYRVGTKVRPPEQQWLDYVWRLVDDKALALGVTVILGTERIEGDKRYITARVSNADGSPAVFQDKVQLDPSEDSQYTAGTRRVIFRCGELSFGVVICHEGWRYPETVRWAARNGAHIVFHPHVEVFEGDGKLWERFADPENSFHEKAALCRAAENSCYFATVNCALPGASTTSALIDPQGFLIAYHPYGQAGLLIQEIDTCKATSLLARRFCPEAYA